MLGQGRQLGIGGAGQADERGCQRQPRLEPAAGGHGRPGQRRGQRQVDQRGGLMSGCRQEIGMRRRVSVKPERGAAQRVVTPPASGLGQCLRDPPPEPPGPQSADPRLLNLPVERMSKPALQPSPVGGHGNQTASLDLFHRRGAGEPGHQRYAQGFAEGENLDNLALVVRQSPNASLDQLDQPLGEPRLPRPPPHPGDVGQPTVLELAVYQLSQIQRIAPGDGPEGLHCGAVHRAGERSVQQLPSLVPRQRLHLQPAQMPVLPQRGHRIGRRLTRAHGQHNCRRPAHRQLVQQHGADVVQQMRVIDGHDHARATCAGHEHFGGSRHEPRRIGVDRTQQPGKSAQRQRPPRGRGDGPSRHRTTPLRIRQRLAG
jgi:hypothetical protein